MVNLFGKGFVGGHYASKYPCIVNDRNDLTIKSNEILYTISTTDNYNVHTNPYIDIETNLTTLIRVLEQCKDKDVTFNFISSWFVYGETESPYRETSPCFPKGFYSITKRTAEQLLISYCETFNIKYRILRLANIIGPDDRNVSPKKNALTYLMRKLQNDEDIELYNDGDFYRDYMHVSDAVEAINLILEKGELNTIYNVATGKSTRFRDCIDYIIKRTGSKSKIHIIEPKEFHRIVQVSSMHMNVYKLKSLGHNVNYSTYQILDELIDGIQK